jgi:DNA (cytosine-5)-methyltransferase 1
MRKNKKYTVYSLFTGGGGFDIGFKEAGFQIIGASDIWKESENTMKLNFPEIPFICKDVRLLTAKEILQSTKNVYPDIIIGGPPCQGFSVMGDKNSADPRNKLFEAYVRLVDDLQPKCFVFENVKGVKTMFGGRYLTEIANSFASIGYNLYLKVLNSADYGVPQSRQRVIIFGTKIDKPFSFPLPNFDDIGKLKCKKNVGDAIMDLAKKNNSFPNHIILTHNDIVIKRYKLIPEGGKLPPPELLPIEIRRKNFGNTYVRLDRKKLSTTMVPGNNAFPIHPTLNRSLTPREAARIQSFPDDFIFTGPRREQCILVGNAVPPLMGAKIALEVKRFLEDKKYKGDEKDLLLKANTQIKNIETKATIKAKSNRLNVIDLFAGAGGISIGFMKAGYNVILDADFDAAVAKTHKHNFPEIPFVHGDLSDPKIEKEVIKTVGDQEVDIIVGGPPCQGFSMFGKRRFVTTKDYDPHTDQRNKLVFTYLKYVKRFKPKWFMMENVPGLPTLDDGWFLDELIKEIEKLGYKNHDWKIINTADYGVPQKRKRFILLANRLGQVIPWPKPKYYEYPSDWQKTYRAVGEVINDLVPKKTQTKFFNHTPMSHSEKVMERFSFIKEGKKLDPKDLPAHLKQSQFGKEIQSFSKVFYRLDRSQPSHTLVPGHSAFPIHPSLNRQLTVREAARIQTFPDELEFLGSHGQQCKQVGNAFPPMAAEVFANMIAKAISNDWKEENLSGLVNYSLIEKSKA